MKRNFLLTFLSIIMIVSSALFLTACEKNGCAGKKGTEGLEYTLSDDGAYYICNGKGVSIDTEIVIASKYNSKPVKCIGDYAFFGCNSLTSVTIPNSVTSIGEDAFFLCSSLTSVTIGDGVTSIGKYAFYNCSSLTSITIPDSVTSIGEGAFYDCSSLTSITIPNSVTSIGERAFYNCSSLTKVNYLGTIDDWVQISFGSYIANPLCHAKKLYINNELVTNAVIENATKINSYAFSHCSSLTSITIPNSVTSIGGGAFYNCSSLTSIEIPNSVASIGDCAFEDCSSLTSIEIPNSVTSIGKYAFNDCSSLTSITIGDSVTSIGSSAFSGCSSLEEITIPFVGAKAGVTSSDTYQYPFGYIFGTSSYTGGVETLQFYYGSSTSDTTYGYYYIPSTLKSVTVTGGNILYGAFYNCSSLKSITIGDSVISIGKYAFEGCSSLEEITIPFVGAKAGVTSSDTYQYPFGYIFGTSSYTGGVETLQFYYGSSTSDTTYGYYYIPSTLKSVTVTGGNILYGAFYNCSSLKSITIGDSVISIGKYAFEGCSSLTSITIPNSVTSIGDGAFEDCSSLTSITIGNSVTSIGDRAFYYCSSLTSVTIPDSVTSIGERAFYNCSSLTSITYNGTKAEWQAISKGYNWKYNVPTSCLIHCADEDLSI